ncbi:MAG TPA: MarR family transcriptional regulator [Chitinophagales bacterium]|nr:MarR family transcriptional regulator [Chitinophagales bacterium]
MGTIEEEIKQQKKFGSEYEKAVVNILYTSSWLYNNNAVRMKKYGITPEQYNVLRILRGAYPKPTMLGDITCRMLDKSSNATRLVEKLRLKALVDRQVCESNRRQVDIKITAEGLSLLTQIDNESDEWYENLKAITKTEAQELNRILDKLRS